MTGWAHLAGELAPSRGEQIIYPYAILSGFSLMDWPASWADQQDIHRGADLCLFLPGAGLSW